MTSMPEVIKAPPPRPAATTRPSSQTGDAAANDPQDGDFAGLLDEAAGDADLGDDGPRTGTTKGRPKAPKPDSTAKSVTADPVPPLMPWLTRPVQPVPPPGAGLDGAAAPAMATTAEPTTGSAAELAAGSVPGTGSPAATTAGATSGATATDGAAPGATPTGSFLADAATAGQPASATAAATATTPPAAAPAGAATVDAAPAAPASDAANAAQPVAMTSVPPAQTPVTAAQTTLTSLPPPSAETPDAEPPVAVEPRRQGRAGRAANAADSRQGTGGGKADPAAALAQTVAGQAGRDGQAPAKGDPMPGLPAPATEGSSGGTAQTGFDALPTLPAQAATQYAAASASGRAPTAHSPAMAQLAAPLVRVAEAGGGEFHIDLAPAELGRVRVIADVSDGQVTLSVQAENADTLALLRRDMQHLEKALGDSGLKLDNATLQFSLQGDGQSRGFGAPDQGSGGAQGSWRGPAAAVAAVSDIPLERAMRPIDGLVDVII